MTRIDRLHIEATIASLDALSFLVGGGAAADCLRTLRVALRQALDADPAPAVVDPYPGYPVYIGPYPPMIEHQFTQNPHVGSVRPPGGPVRLLDQQYDADAPLLPNPQPGVT